MEFTFWGTRGSIANASAETIRHGGNTSCVEIRSGSGTLIVLDCGTGGYALGQALLSSPGGGKRGHLLISHTHWDHIQGIPFFAPLFDPSATWDIYAPHGLHQTLRDTLAGQMNYTYSPITLNDMGANINFHELVEGVFEIDGISVQTQFLNHPALTLGYRLEVDGVSLVYACDHEPVSKQAIPSEEDLNDKESRHVEFLRDADVVIHDTQYTAAEYADKVGWGHSTFEYATAVCIKAGVKKLVLTHHDPSRSDDSIDAIVAELREKLKKAGSTLEVIAAAEQQPGTVMSDASDKSRSRSPRKSAKTKSKSAIERYTVLLGNLRSDAHNVLRLAASKEDCKVVSGTTIAPTLVGNSASLLIFDTHTPASEITGIVQSVKEQQDEAADVPVLMINYPDDPKAGPDHEELASEWITWPFSEQYARAKIRAWILRTSCRWVRATPPENEAARLDELHSLNILHTQPEERFDRITRLAAETLSVPIALISLVDKETQWFKSCIGLDVNETSREVAFCAHAILEEKPLVIPDTLLDSRFADNPLVVGPPHIRFYAGCPLYSPNHLPLGTLCMIDSRPRYFDARQLTILSHLATLVTAEIANNPA